MHLKATQALYSMMGKIAKILQHETAGEGERAGVMPVFALLFREMRRRGDSCVRMTDVSRRLSITKPAATQAVNRLVDKGLVERVSDENDRRVVYIRPTAEGDAAFENELEVRLDFVDRAISRMGENRAEQLAELLDSFLNAVSEELEERD